VIETYLRLAFATLLVFAPGRLIARALGLRGACVTLAFTLASFFIAWAVVFTVHGSAWLAIGLLALIGLAALVARGRVARASLRAESDRPARQSRGSLGRGHALVFAAGVVLGLGLWRVAGAVTGDGLFHLHVVLVLDELGTLHLRSVDQFRTGSLHPGYAFPLWHALLAVVGKLSGLAPYTVVDHEASLLAPLALLVVFEAGFAVFESAGAAFAVVGASLALYCFAAGHGGSFVTLALPATAAKQILVPALTALFFRYLSSGRRGELVALGALFGSLALIHSTYALFGLIPLVAYAVVRRSDWARSAVAIVVAVIPAFAVYLWLRPLIDQTATQHPDAASRRDALLHYAGQLVVHSLSDYHLAAGVVGRAGAVAVAALFLVPVAGIAVARRWAVFVLAGSVTVLALMLVPELFTHFSAVVTISQARRAAGFLPFSFAFAGGLLLLTRSVLLLPVALAAGILFQELWPGDFASGTHGGPAWLTWFALVGGASALVLGLLLARRPPRERPGLAGLAALLFVLPVAFHGLAHWSAATPIDRSALPASLRAQLAAVPAGATVLAGPTESYEILADAPVYVVAAPLYHVAHTRANAPEQRIRAVDGWLRTHNPAVPRRYGATWAVIGQQLYALKNGRPVGMNQ
jgi:hypothetical protein